jgi:hypothetical protein
MIWPAGARLVQGDAGQHRGREPGPSTAASPDRLLVRRAERIAAPSAPAIPPAHGTWPASEAAWQGDRAVAMRHEHFDLAQFRNGISRYCSNA